MHFNYFFRKLSRKDDPSFFKQIPGFFHLLRIRIGDCIKIYFSHKGSFFFVEGFVAYMKNKGFFTPEVSLIVYSKLKGFRVKFSFSFFYNLLFSFERLDYKKLKKSNYVSAT
jgi:hypothetical protein